MSRAGRLVRLVPGVRLEGLKRVVIVVLVAVLSLARVSLSQERNDAAAVRRPQFLLESSNGLVPVDLARSPLLTRRVSINLTSARLADAIAEVSRQTSMAIVFSDDVLSSEARVDLHAQGISVAAALTEILLDRNLDVVIRPDGSAALVRYVAPLRAPVPGSIAGKVTDANNGLAIDAATIVIDDPALMATTSDDGAYRIARVPSGTRTVTVRRVGYAPEKRTLSVTDGHETQLDVGLAVAAMSLHAQVVTATGQHRRVELGNSIATVDAGQRTSTAPVKSMGDLLTAQMTGVQVSDASLTGVASRIRIRGQSSLSLNNDPIYIIDGVRMISATGGASTGGISFTATTGVGASSVPSRVNDIDPEEIESIEVVKGPSAATLYGTDAANGVIVITTKRGRVGKPVWNFHGEWGRLDDRNDYMPTYGLLGHSPGTSSQRACFTYQLADGSCTLDSAVSLDLFKNSNLTTLKLGSRRLVGGQLSGGSDGLRYLVSADANNEIGPVGIPAAFEQAFRNQGIDVPANVRRPNALSQLSLRTNLDAVVNPQLDIAVSAALVNSEMRLPQQGNNGTASYTEYEQWGPGYDDGSVDVYGQRLYGWFAINPARVFQLVSRQNARRFLGSGSVNWRPEKWLQARADVGYDLTNQADFFLKRPGEGPSGASVATDGRTTHIAFTNNLGATASWDANAWAQLRTSVGAQFVMQTSSTSIATGTNLAPGGESPSQGTTLNIVSLANPSKTLGLFIEEQAAIRDRLFVTAAVRTDRNSAFGVNYGSAYYPKFSLSWMLSDEPFFPHIKGVDQFRARWSYGASGVQPAATSALRVYNTTTAVSQGVLSSGLVLSNPGNANLRPERSVESDAGIDARLINGRANLELTWYKKNTHDALITQSVAPSAGVGSYLANLGGVQNAGIEYRLQTQLIDRSSIGWDITFGGSYNFNRITSLGPLITTPTSTNQVGRPINSLFRRSLTWNDANGDGLLAPSEVTLGPANVVTYAGTTLPPAQMSLSTGIEVVKRRLRISALADRKSDGVLSNGELWLPCLVRFNCVDQRRNDLPLWRQARGLAEVLNAYNGGYIESSNYTRLREISATLALGDRLAKRVRSSGASLTAAARNVYLWTRWTGTDPEAYESSGADVPTFIGGTSAPPMYYMLRLNLSY